MGIDRLIHLQEREKTHKKEEKRKKREKRDSLMAHEGQGRTLGKKYPDQAKNGGTPKGRGAAHRVMERWVSGHLKATKEKGILLGHLKASGLLEGHS